MNKLLSPKNGILKTASLAGSLINNPEYDNVEPPNIVVVVSNGKIISANTAACRLLGYSKKELVKKRMAAIVDINDSRFKKMSEQRKATGHSRALVTLIRKSGMRITCLISSTLFKDSDGIEKAITMISDMSQAILMQKNIAIENKRIADKNIAIGKTTKKKKKKNQNTINEKVVAENIAIAISKQIELDTIKEKIVADNIAIAMSKRKKPGFSNDKLVAKNIAIALAKQKVIDTKNKKIVAENIAIALAKQKVIDIKNDKIVADNIIIALAKSEARMGENNKWIKHIAQNSFDVMWEWNVTTNEIYVGESIAEVFGYKVPNNTASFAHFIGCLLPEEKDNVKKELSKTLDSGAKRWKDSFRFRRNDGTLAFATIRGSILRDGEGKVVRLIGALKDISRLNELEKKLEEQVPILQEHSEKFILAAKLSFGVIWDWDLLTNEIFIGDQFRQLFGYKIKNNKGQ